jgi:tRNA (cytidine32/uridine32-2'-O)-methyltransferase
LKYPVKLKNIKIVMVETTHPGNIGGAARAMKNMQLENLVLVNPKCPIGERAYARASGANNVLDKHLRVDSLPEALSDCHLVVGTSARIRSLTWPQLNPRELGEKANSLADDQKLALVFGREHAGLTNEELQHCHFTVNIPTDPDFSSLNVAAAIQVISYEIYSHYQQNHTNSKVDSDQLTPVDEKLASSGELEGYFQHLEQVLISTQFLDASNPRQMMKRLRRLYQRALPTQNEVNILRGILSSVEKFKK